MGGQQDRSKGRDRSRKGRFERERKETSKGTGSVSKGRNEESKGTGSFFFVFYFSDEQGRTKQKEFFFLRKVKLETGEV